MTDFKILHGDALQLLPTLADGSANLIVTDPPYYRVKSEEWDRQWASESIYLDWLGQVAMQWQRVLAPNGSLYVFAAPKMAAQVEVMLGERFNVLNSITWAKPEYSTKAEMTEKEDKRKFFEASERILFCEQWGSDDQADSDAGYTAASVSLKQSIMGAYLESEFNRAGASRRDIAALFPSETGNLTGCVSNWVLGYNLPTPDQYQSMREYLNSLNGSEYLRQEYEDLRQEYEDLRQEYEDLRQEYEDLRRPFNLTADIPYTDFWTFKTVNTYPGKHPTEKPQALLRHIIEVSSKPGDLVLDTFAGSGAHGVAAVSLGRRFIGIEQDDHWAVYAERRLRDGVQLSFFKDGDFS